MLSRGSFSTGISFSKYISKDSLSFYTTPIQNEFFAYFSYKKWWLRPSISVSYGWGSKTEYEKRKHKLEQKTFTTKQQVLCNQSRTKNQSMIFPLHFQYERILTGMMC